MSAFSDRLNSLVTRENRHKLTDAAGVSTEMIRLYLNGENVPKPEVLFKIATFFGVSPDWLLTGKEDESAKMSEFHAVPYLRHVRASCGAGSLVESGFGERFLAFRKEWIAATTRCSLSDLVAITAWGDSMEPQIVDGDVLLVDQSVKFPLDGKIHVFRLEDQIFVKEMRQVQAKAWDVIQYNPRISFFTLAGDYSGFELYGRVIWIGRTL